MFIIRFAFYFCLSFLILCIPIGGNQILFDKLYSMATPYASKAIKATKQKFSSTKRYSRKLYSNSEPEESDEVKSKLAGIQKKKIKTLDREPEDAYTSDEEVRLRKVLNSNE